MGDDARRWRGRVLPRPDEELVDQGLAFDLRTALDRRLVLRGLGVSALAVGLAACGGEAPAGSSGSGSSGSSSPTASADSTGEIPDETAGPYPGDGSNGADVLERSGIVRGDIRSSLGGGATAEGVPMTLELTIQKLSDGTTTPYEGVAVYVWHCDREGRYSMYSQGVEDETYLRGVQVADSAGVVRFASIFPACYSGRWPHVHFEVYPDAASITDATKAIATSQVALPETTCRTVYAEDGYSRSAQNLSRVSLADDNVFGDDDGRLQIGTVTGSVTAGYTVALTARVDPSTKPTGGGAPGGRGGRGGGPGGLPPSGGPSGGSPPSQ